MKCFVICFLIGICFSGCQRDRNDIQRNDKPESSAGVGLQDSIDCRFQAEKSWVRPLHNGIYKLFISNDAQIAAMEPLAAFKKLEQGKLSTELDDSSDKFFVGILQGRLYNIDTFEVLESHQEGDTLNKTVRYTKRNSQHYDPAPAKAYFIVRTDADTNAIRMSFQYVDETFEPIYPFYGDSLSAE